MNRRQYLISAGGVLGAIGGGLVVGKVTRADVFLDSDLTWGEGDAATIEKSITRESVEYLQSSDRVRENSYTQPFPEWATSECAEIGAKEVPSIVDSRIDKEVEGIGSGVKLPIFGPLITADHTISHNREGEVISEPNITLERLISVAPRTITVTLSLKSEEHTKTVPVGVGRVKDWLQ